MSEQPRPVWIWPGERDLLARFLEERDTLSLAAAIVRRFDAAPADATEAVRETIAEWHRADTPEMRDVSQERAVLSALGMPDA